jgi:hypothetical protein
MKEQLTIGKLVVHYVDKRADRLFLASADEDVTKLEPAVLQFFSNLVQLVWNAEDSGSTRSALFREEPIDQGGPPRAREVVQRLLQDESAFYHGSVALATDLFQQSPGNASPGLLAVLRLTDQVAQRPHVVILKIQHRDASFVSILDDIPTELRVAQVANLLQTDIQKGAIFPHPERERYDVKIIDRQATEDPARYFVESFLGCRAKGSDEHQVRRLIPALTTYGRLRGLQARWEALPAVFVSLQQSPHNITAPVLAKVVSDHGLYVPSCDPQDLVTFIDRESDLAPLDIPRQRFQTRGRQGTTERQITIRFTEPPYRGVTLSGSPSTLSRILKATKNGVTLQIRTSKHGYETAYS